MKRPGVLARDITKVNRHEFTLQPDLLVIEEPLEMRLTYTTSEKQFREIALTVTMRTPGNDFELVIGFLYAEGIIIDVSDIKLLYYCEQTIPEAKGNVIKVILQPGITPDHSLLERNFNATSSCGVCGKQSIAQIVYKLPSLKYKGQKINPSIIKNLSETLAKNQSIFNHTGGLHAAALFDHEGTLQYVREDIGRHNALDKIIGSVLRENPESFEKSILLVSGRVGYELVQKAAVAGITVMVAVGAPSSLAVQIADQIGMTLIGFAKNHSFNIYTEVWRIAQTENNLVEKTKST